MSEYERLAEASRVAWRRAMRCKMREHALEFRVQATNRLWDGDFDARVKSMLHYLNGAAFYRRLSE